MVELPMAAAHANLNPAVVFKHLDEFSDLHGRKNLATFRWRKTAIDDHFSWIAVFRLIVSVSGGKPIGSRGLPGSRHFISLAR